MSDITVKHNGYSYSIAWDGQHYVAICDRSGRVKLRRDRHVWVNEITDEHGTVIRHERIVGQETLIARLERGVCELQALHSTTPKPERNGHHAPDVRRGRAKLNRRAMPANVRDARVE